MKNLSRLMDTVFELNIACLVFLFPFMHVGAGRLFNTLWSALLVLWAIRMITLRKTFRLQASTPMLFVFAGTIVLSGLFPAEAGMRLKGLSYVLQGIAIFLAVYDFYRGHNERADRTRLYLISCTSMISIDAVIQVILGRDIFGIPLSVSRATALFVHPFYLSLWSGIGLFSVLSWSMETPPKYGKVLPVACLFILAAAFVLSKTRAAWLAMLLLLLIAFMYVPEKKRLLKFLIPGLSLPFILLAADHALRARFISIFTSEDPRRAIWLQAWNMIVDTFSLRNWLIGRGPGLFKIEYPRFDLVGGGETFPHLIGLELLHAAGMLSVIAFSAWLAHYLFTVFLANGPAPKTGRTVFITYMPLLVLAICFINESFFSRYFSFLFWFAAGFAAAYSENSRGLGPLYGDSP